MKHIPKVARPTRVQFRVGAEELAIIETAAARLSIDMSTFVRSVAVREARRTLAEMRREES